MPSVAYDCLLAYLRRPEDGVSYPGLVVQLERGGLAIDVLAALDSGAGGSLFHGELASALGLDLLSGDAVRFESTAGQAIEARRHQVVLHQEFLGTFQMSIAFSMGSIRRNLLGRDFFNLVQIGFRERYFEVYASGSP